MVNYPRQACLSLTTVSDYEVEVSRTIRGGGKRSPPPPPTITLDIPTCKTIKTECNKDNRGQRCVQIQPDGKISGSWGSYTEVTSGATYLDCAWFTACDKPTGEKYTTSRKA